MKRSFNKEAACVVSEGGTPQAIEAEELSKTVEEGEDTFQEFLFCDNDDEHFIIGRVRPHCPDAAADGPVSIDSIDAEITVIDDAKKKIYLHGEWVDTAPDEILCEAAYESICDLNIIIKNTIDKNELETAVKERDRIRENAIKDERRFEKYYDDLESLIRFEMIIHPDIF